MSESEARKTLESLRWPNGVTCPECGGPEKVSGLPMNGSMGPGWYACAACRIKFTVRTGTVMHRSHVPLSKWLAAKRLFDTQRNVTIVDVQKATDVTYRTAAFLHERLASRQWINLHKIVDGERVLVGPAKRIYRTRTNGPHRP